MGYTANAGALKPAAFSVNGEQTTIQALKWENGIVTMGLSAGVPLTGHRMDFIALDGSVSLSLSFDDTQTQSESGLLTWNVPQQPWQDGDQLMLRIRNAEP